MRFTRIEVEGFGILHDTVIDGIGEGLTVIGGRNGAGKSSLHAFLTRVVFGIPRSNAVDVTRHFEPLRDGRQGGVVQCTDADGAAWRIRRIKGGNPTLEVEGPNGTSHTSSALRPLVGDLDRRRFEQLFAIDLDDLIGIDDLPGDQLQRMLFDAATLGTAGSLRGARALAEERAEALYKPSGRVQPIAEARRERRELAEELREARARVAGLEDLRGQVEQAEAERARLAEEVEQLDRDASIIGRVTQAWPSHREAARQRKLADELTGPDVPDALREQVDEARETRDRTTAEVTALQERLDEARSELGGIHVDQRVLDQADAIERLHVGRPVHEDREQRHAAAREHHRTAAATAERAVERIGPSWTVAQVRQVAVDGEAVDRVHAAAEALAAAGDDHRAAVRRAEEAVAAVEHRSAAIARRQEDLEEPVPEEQLAAHAEAVATLKAHVPVLEQADAAAGLGMAGGGGAPGDATSSRVLPLALLVVGALALVAAVVLAMTALAVLGGVLAASGAFLVGRARRDGRRDPAPGGWSPPARVDQLRDQVAQAAELLHLPARPDLGALARAEAWLAREKEKAAARRSAERELDERRHELVDAQQAADQLQQQAAEAAIALDRARHTLEEVCDQVGFRPAHDLPPDAVVQLHQRIATAARALDAAGTAAEEVRALAEELEEFRGDAVEVCAAVGRGTLDGHEAVHTIPGLQEALDAARTARERTQQVERSIEQLESQLATAEQELGACERTLVEACASVGVQTADELDELVQRHDERRGCLEAAAQAEAEIARLLGEGDAAERARELLEEGDVAGWDAMLERINEQRAELTDRRDQLLEDRTLAEREIAELGGDDTIPQLALDIEMLQERLDELSHRWAVLEVARSLLDNAVEHFEARQQPVVLEMASELFHEFTCQEWDEVRQTDRRLYATRTGDREPVAVEQLSTGEQAQLYLALRVALATHRDARLPLLLDDLLQSSDDDRAAAICSALATLAADRQVLLFTPSQRMLEATLEAVPGAGYVILDDGDVAEASMSQPVATLATRARQTG